MYIHTLQNAAYILSKELLPSRDERGNTFPEELQSNNLNKILSCVF